MPSLSGILPRVPGPAQPGMDADCPSWQANCLLSCLGCRLFTFAGLHMDTSDELKLISDASQYLQQRGNGMVPNGQLVKSWREFYEVFNRLIFRLARSRSVPESKLDDCIQDIWMTLIVRLPRFNFQPQQGRFGSWLYIIVRNAAFDTVRDSNPRLTFDTDLVLGSESSNRDTMSPFLSDRTSERDTVRKICGTN